MVQQFILSFLAVLCAVGLSTQQSTERCWRQSDCGPGYCCSKRIFVPEAYCVPKRKLNEICIAGQLGETLYNGLFDITCPCEEPMLCIQDESVNSKGEIFSHGNARCRLPNYGGSGYGYANAGASSYAGSGNPYYNGGSSSYANSGNPYYASGSSTYGNSGNPYYNKATGGYGYGNSGYSSSNSVANANAAAY